MGGREAARDAIRSAAIDRRGRLQPPEKRRSAFSCLSRKVSIRSKSKKSAAAKRSTSRSQLSGPFERSCVGRGWKVLVARSLRIHVKPVLGRSNPLPKITRSDVVTVFDQMPDCQVANRRNVFAVLRRMFRWAVQSGRIDRSPMEGMETPPAVKARDRSLSDQKSPEFGSMPPRPTIALARLCDCSS